MEDRWPFEVVVQMLWLWLKGRVVQVRFLREVLVLSRENDCGLLSGLRLLKR